MGRDEEEQQSRGFKVEDRRRFAQPDAGEAEAAAEETRPDPPPATDASGREAPSPGFDEADQEGPLAEMTFSTFVMGLSTQALMYLGEIVDPVRRLAERDLPAAKQMIDLLAILHEKTKGNLDTGEDKLLGDMLYDLRMRYVELVRGG